MSTPSGGTKKKGGSLVVWGAIALTALLAIGQYKKMEENKPRKAPQHVAEQSVTQTRVVAEARCPTASTEEWQPTDAPTATSDWPKWVDIPRCHRIVWCVPDEHNVCKQRDVAGYDEQCRIGSVERTWDPEGCRVGNASRIRSQSDTPLKGAVYKLVFTG